MVPIYSLKKNKDLSFVSTYELVSLTKGVMTLNIKALEKYHLYFNFATFCEGLALSD